MVLDRLNKMGLPVICIDARHAKAALKMQINKSDRNDAVGIARIMQCGWYKEVRVKDLDSHATKALLVSRALLVWYPWVEDHAGPAPASSAPPPEVPVPRTKRLNPQDSLFLACAGLKQTFEFQAIV